MTAATETAPPRSVAHYRWAVTFQHAGDDPVTVKGTMTSIATPEDDERAIRFVTETSFREKHPDRDGPLSVLSFTLEPDDTKREPQP